MTVIDWSVVVAYFVISAAIGTLAALLTECTIEVERVEPGGEQN